MRRRSGFVSNSSSSSFVLVGYHLNILEDEQYEKACDNFTLFHSNDKTMVIGAEIYTFSDDCEYINLSTNEFLEKISKEKEKLIKFLKENNIEFEKEKDQIFMGTRMC